MRARDYVGVVLGLAVMGGCAAEGAERDEDDALQLAATQLPDAPRIAEVTATGEACPKGTWHAAFSADREYLVVRFDDFDLGVDSRHRTDAGKCSLSIRVAGEEATTYAPISFGITAGLKQADGGSLNILTTAYWANAPDRRAISDAPYTGAIKGGDMATGAIFDGRVWSPCSGERTLQIDLDAKLQSAGDKGTFSYKQMHGLAFSVRRCDTGTSAAADAGAAVSAPDASTGPAPLPPSGLVIKSVRAFGVLCDNAKIELSPDGQNFTVEDLSSLSGTPGSFSNPIGHCSLGIEVELPAGQAFALESLAIEGEASLVDGQSLHLSTTPGFTGRGGPGVAGSNAVFNKFNLIEGPFSGAFSTVHRYAGDDLYFSSCDTTRSLQAGIFASLNAAQKAGNARITKVGPVKLAVKNCNTLRR